VATDMQDDLRKMIERLLNQKRPIRKGPIKRKPRQIGIDVGPFPDSPKRPNHDHAQCQSQEVLRVIVQNHDQCQEFLEVKVQNHDQCQEFLEVMVQNHARCQNHAQCQENQEREYSG
jgi:hypothetical protein